MLKRNIAETLSAQFLILPGFFLLYQFVTMCKIPGSVFFLLHIPEGARHPAWLLLSLPFPGLDTLLYKETQTFSSASSPGSQPNSSFKYFFQSNTASTAAIATSTISSVGSMVVSSAWQVPAYFRKEAILLSLLPAHWIISKEMPATTGTMRRRPSSLTQ